MRRVGLRQDYRGYTALDYAKKDEIKALIRRYL